MPCYKSCESMMTRVCYKSGNNDNESDNNEDKIGLLQKRWGLVDDILDHVLDHMLDHMIIDLMNMTLPY